MDQDKDEPKVTGRTLWGDMQTKREPVLMRARACAALTIPSLIPPEGANDSTMLPTPFQSVGARGVNNLTSKLMLALFPAGTTFFRLTVDPAVASIAGPGLGAVYEKLGDIEQSAMRKFDTSAIRPQLNETLLHLVVAGNKLVFFKNVTEFRAYSIDKYCISRDACGNPLTAVVKDTVAAKTLAPAILQACDVTGDDCDKEVDLYTVVQWSNKKVEYWQELNDKEVPGSRGKAPSDKSPWMPLRWKAVPGQAYGRGHVEEYLGDLTSLESLSQAMVEFASIAAKIVFLVHPNASTDISDVNNALTGEAVQGSRADIDVLQLDKQADFQVANGVAQRIEERLSYAFLLRAGVTRDAERVTAEEIRATAQELEDALGGVYTTQAQDLQLPFVRRLLGSLTKAGAIVSLPKGTVEPVIVTGFQALGRNQELNALRGFLGDLQQFLGQTTPITTVLNGSDIALRLGTGYGVQGLSSLIKSQDQIDAENQQTAQSGMSNTMLGKAAGPIAAALGKHLDPAAMAAMAQNAQKQPPQGQQTNQ